ncbi:MAG: hypothetical protein WAL04_16865 [Acidimicrobiales bacterium]|jgi:hypothetical protein
MADERSLSDVFWDYGVYAPIGLAVSIAEELPRLSDKGRERAASHIHIARVIGKLAVGQGKRQFGKVFGEPPQPMATSQRFDAARTATAPESAAASATSDASSNGGGSKRPSRASGNGKPSAGGRVAPGRGRQAKPASGATSVPAPTVTPPVSAAPAAVAPVPAAGSLAIPGYDTLAASQVVQRLSSLRPDELEAIRRYELSTRGRRTILHRIAQLATDR